ncbi:MAG: hypothetical protein LBV40_01810 [Methanomicrobiales archaeon]|nr:hypothetical protein [Methanomicrobiales archaeon]
MKPTNPVYLAVIAVVIIGIAAVLIWTGFVQSATSEEAMNGLSQPWEITYLGAVDEQASEDERQKYLNTFTEHNAGVKDACEIMYFYNYHCGACQLLAPWLDEFKERYPEVLITSYEIHDEDSTARLESAKIEYGISSSFVPIIFICGSVIEGVETIQNMFEPMALSVYSLPLR